MTRTIRVVFLFILALALPALALASDPVGKPAPGVLAPLLAEVLPVLGAALAALLAALLKRLLDKIDAERKLLKDEHADSLALRIVSALEERAADLVRREGPRILEGEEKMVSAVASLMARIPGLSEPDARELVRAALVRIGAGASARVAAEADKALDRNP